VLELGNQAKLFHMVMKATPARSTLADALELQDWRTYHALAQRLIVRARSLYAQDRRALGARSGRECVRAGHHHFRGAFYVMDHGYMDFARLYSMPHAGAFFVTRAKPALTRVACTRRRPSAIPE